MAIKPPEVRAAEKKLMLERIAMKKKCGGKDRHKYIEWRSSLPAVKRKVEARKAQAAAMARVEAAETALQVALVNGSEAEVAAAEAGLLNAQAQLAQASAGLPPIGGVAANLEGVKA